jgi:hypothetical protein
MSKKIGITAACLFLLCTIPVFSQSTAFGDREAKAARLEGLVNSITETPYSALVVHTKVKVIPLPAPAAKPKKGAPKEDVVEDAGEERHVYSARVLETFKGKARATIRYEMFVEKGESPELDKKPQIVTLCKSARGFYLPGVGTSFPGEAELISEARRVAKLPTKRAEANKSLCD